MLTGPEILASLESSLIASCQPVRGGVFDEPSLVALFALAAASGGCAGLRVEGLPDLAAVRAVTDLPIVGLVKHEPKDSRLFITPLPKDVFELARAGADVIAFDATTRERPVSVWEMIRLIHASGCLAMADVATAAEGAAVHQAGADFVASTLSGYTPDSPSGPEPDFGLISELRSAGARVVAEGRIFTPAQAAKAVRRGAFCVTVGTAISRPELITGSFAAAITEAARAART
jgi:N-acylglucosamine-6-phosphate 2-epimerase